VRVCESLRSSEGLGLMDLKCGFIVDLGLRVLDLDLKGMNPRGIYRH